MFGSLLELKVLRPELRENGVDSEQKSTMLKLRSTLKYIQPSSPK